MGVFDWFSRRRRPEAPGDLLEALIDAANSGRHEELVQLINANLSTIRESFPDWTTVPPETRNEPKALERYVQTLYKLAQIFEHLGDSSLLAQLQGGDRNPMAEWNSDLEKAKALIDDQRAAEAVALLNSVLVKLDRVSGSAVQYYRPRVLGILGIALQKAGDRSEAVRVTKEALELCKSAGDEEGVRAYTNNLDEFGTYQRPARDGTDANVTVALKDGSGHTLTLDDLRTVSGTVKWEVRWDASIPTEARRVHEEGRAAGARGDFDAALSLLTRAAELAPLWPYPFYDRAYTHLLREDFHAALDDYRRTLELSPDGFFTAAVAVDILTRESAGEFFSGLYGAFAMLEHMPTDQRRSIAGQLVEKMPSFAPGWNELAEHVTDPAERLDVLERGLAARPDPHTRGMLLIKKAVTLSELGDAEGASSLLHSLVADSTTMSTRVVAEFALTKLASRPE